MTRLNTYSAIPFPESFAEALFTSRTTEWLDAFMVCTGWSVPRSQHMPSQRVMRGRAFSQYSRCSSLSRETKAALFLKFLGVSDQEICGRSEQKYPIRHHRGAYICRLILMCLRFGWTAAGRPSGLMLWKQVGQRGGKRMFLSLLPLSVGLLCVIKACCWGPGIQQWRTWTNAAHRLERQFLDQAASQS